MEEKCLDSVNSITLNLIHSSSVASSSTTTTSSSIDLIEEPHDLLLLNQQPSTSTSRRSSMSLLQEDFAHSQHDFAEVLDDDETTTSGVLETFEISSSNSLPTCSADGTVAAAAVDDSTSTDTIKLSGVIGEISSDDPPQYNNNNNNAFAFNPSEIVYEINDDDDDDDESSSNANSSQMTLTAGDGQLNGVIMTTGGPTIYLETPVVDEQPHHPQIISLAGQLEFNEKAGKPKRLSDEFLLAEETDALVDDNDVVDAPSTTVSKYIFEANESPDMGNKSETSAEGTAEALHDRMSFRLKKMNINNCTSHIEASANALNDLPSSSSHSLIAPTMADIKSMDLTERRDFETEQRLTGGIILKSSSLINKNKLNLSLLKSCTQDKQQQQQQSLRDDDCPSSSSGRAVSSDSKCVYKDPSATPTSSRNYNSRLTKSTAKLNLCSTLSHPQKQQQPKLTATTSTSTSSSSSVIVEAPTTSAKVSNAVGADIFSNSNSNDSLMGGITATTTTTIKNCQQEQKQQKLPSTATTSTTTDRESGCSRTSALHSAAADDNDDAAVDDAEDDEDAQPSTSSARCQYALPPKNLRQVNASAQTSERYLSRYSALATGLGLSSTASSAASNVNENGVGVNLSRNRTRRLDPTAHLTRNSTSEEVIAAFKVFAERGEFNDDSSWADCEENNTNLEDICTCHHSSSGGSSNHGGSNTSLNDTVDFDSSAVGCVVSKDGDLSNYIQMVSISEETGLASPDCFAAASSSSSGNTLQQRKRKYNEGRILDTSEYSASGVGSGGAAILDANSSSRKRIAYDYALSPRSTHIGAGALVLASTPTTHQQLMLSATGGSPLGRRTPRSIIPTRDNPPPELPHWLTQFQRWTHVERLLALDRLIEHCEPTQVRHMMKVIEPQFQRDFISLLPRELALQVLAYLEPKDLLRAAQTCRSWRFLCDDNLLWKEKCRKSQILTEPRSDRPKRGRAGNMPPIASPWKAAYMRQHIIEMNWRSRPIREPKVLKGHDDHVITCLQFSGNRIVSGSDDNTLKVWSAVTGGCLRTLMGHTGGVWSSQMSGNIIISGSTDRTLRVWDMETGQCVHTLQGHTSTVRCMHLHGNKVVSGSRDATLRVWDIEQGSCLHVLVGHLAAVRCVQYDGKLIVSGAYDYMVKIWHPERQECLHTLQGHTNRVYSLQFDGMHVVSGSLDTSIRVWDVETGNCKHTLMGHQSLTSGMELRQNILVSGNADSTVKVWDITTGQCLQTLSGPNKHQSAVTCLQFNSRFVVTSSDDGTVKLWDVKTGEFIRNLVALDSGGSGGVVWRIRANDTKLICAVGSRNGTEETKLMVLDFDVEGACVKCS